MEKILIIGASGQIGTELIYHGDGPFASSKVNSRISRLGDVPRMFRN
jgi:hypothetical protein